MKTAKLLPYAVTIAVGVAFFCPAHAEDWKATGEFGWFGVGKAFQIEKGHVYWLGEFTGTFFNDKGKGSLFDRAPLKCPAHFDFDINNKKAKAGGYCVIGDTSGDQAYLSWQNEGDGVTGPGTFHYTGGTGKYEGIKGDGTFVGVTQINWADGTSSGYSTWNR